MIVCFNLLCKNNHGIIEKQKLYWKCIKCKSHRCFKCYENE